MIDPIIFSLEKYGIPITLRWYGVLVMLGVIVGAWFAERELKRRGENGERIWDALVWVLIPGIVGARLWYVANATLGGDSTFTQNPSEILRIWNGGLHFFGGLLFGAIALVWYIRQNKLDLWLFLDAIAPVTLIGQAVARPANFINQELYGHPTPRPWGIPIDQYHRLPQYAGLPDTTRFHPTFAYEMIWNFAAAALILWLARKYADQMKPGAVFSGWLILAGIGRVMIEFYRPDQPKIGTTLISYSMIVAALMALAGVILLLIRYKKLNLAFAENWEEEYQIPGQQAAPAINVDSEQEDEIVEVKKPKVVRAKKVSSKSKTVTTAKKITKKPAARKTTPARKPAAKKPATTRTTKR